MTRLNAGNYQNLRAVGYVRRSTDKQEHSIDDQKKAIERYVAGNSLHLVRFYIDDAISGTSTSGRRAFLQMISDAEASSCDFNKIIVYDVKRFGRLDNDEAGYYRHILRTNGVEVLYVSENFNGDTTDDFVRPVKQWQARQESKDLSKVTIRGLLSKVEGGWWMGGVPPYGYDLRYENADGKFLFIVRFMPDGSKQVLNEQGNVIRTLARGESLNISKRDYARLTPSDPERVKIIWRIFKMYVEEGKGYKSSADTLNQQGIATPRGTEWSYIYSGKWADTSIRAILVNPLYIGDMVWNRRTESRFHRISNGQAIDRRNIDEVRFVPNHKQDWIIIRDTHPPLISRRLFEQARQRYEAEPSSIKQRGKNHGRTWNGQRSRFILSGLIKCSLCGCRYRGITKMKGKRRIDGTPVKTRYYGCGGYITKGRSICELNPIPKEALESLVTETVIDFYRPYLAPDGRKKLADAVRTQIDLESEEFINARKRVHKQLNKIKKNISNLLDNRTTTNRELVDQRPHKLQQRKNQLEVRLEELDRLVISQAEIKSIVADTMQFLSSLKFTFREGLPQEKLVALRRCIERILVNKPSGTAKLTVYSVPFGNLQGTEECRISL